MQNDSEMMNVCKTMYSFRENIFEEKLEAYDNIILGSVS